MKTAGPLFPKNLKVCTLVFFLPDTWKALRDSKDTTLVHREQETGAWPPKHPQNPKSTPASAQPLDTM